MLAFAAATLFLTIWYLFFSLSPWIVWLTAGVMVAGVIVRSMRVRESAGERVDAWVDPYAGFLFLGVLIGDWILLRTFLIERTSDALSSPWNVLPPAVFSLFFVTSFFLLLLSREKNQTVTMVASSLHIFTALSVSSIVYGVGFGFDAFLHRAAQQALFETGSILPKTPLYAGQYVLISALSHLTHLPIKLIDIWLVPVLASTILPLAFKKHAPFLLLFPFAALTFTVPYNLTVVYALWLIAWWVAPPPFQGGGRGEVIGLVALAVLGVCTHPLLGLPIAIMTGYVIYQGSTPRSTPTTGITMPVITIILVGLSVPALMFFYNTLQGVPLATTNPFTRLELFVSLFRDPFPPAYGPTGGWWDIFYSWNFTLPLLLAVASLPLVYRLGQNNEKSLAQRLGILTVGIFIITFLLSTLFVFKDVIVFEQFEYALRLLHVIPLLLSVLSGLLLSKLLDSTAQKPILNLLIMGLAALAMTTSLYFSYPQENPKVQIAGPSVSEADVLAVHKIDEDAKGEPYIVLSNQMTSAAAIQEFGFRDYVQTDTDEVLWYAIPTGGPLYQFYSDMTYWQPRRDFAENAADFANVKTVYYLVYRYWPGYEHISNLIGKDADSIMRVNKGDIIIFKFNVSK